MTSMPDFAAAANAADSKKKPNKTIIYSAVAAAAVVLLVAGVFGVKAVLRAQAYSGAIAAIDSVKNVAKKKDMKLSETSINDNTTADFFIKTGGAPNKTLFKEAKTPEEALAKYDNVMKQLSNRRNAFGDKTVAEKIDSTKEAYEKFRKHADASTKFFKVVNKYSDEINRSMSKAQDIQDGGKDAINQVSELINKLNNEMNKFKSSDNDFDKLAKNSIGDLNKIVVEIRKNINSGKSMYDISREFYANTSFYESIKKISEEFKQLGDYFEETVSLRNQFVDKLSDLHSALEGKK